MTPAEKLAAEKQRQRPRRNASKRKPGPLACSVRAKREALNLSLHDVAKALPISVAGLHAIEFGNDPQMTTAFKLAAFFGCRIEELWERKE